MIKPIVSQPSTQKKAQAITWAFQQNYVVIILTLVSVTLSFYNHLNN